VNDLAAFAAREVRARLLGESNAEAGGSNPVLRGRWRPSSRARIPWRTARP
jgi:hypothetical protein